MASIYVRHELLRNETVRFTTLQYFNLSLNKRKTIAQAGFFYDKVIEKFVCFSCNLLFDKTIHPNELLKMHFIKFKNCPWLNGYDVSIKDTPNHCLKGKCHIEDFDYLNRDVDWETELSGYSLNSPTSHLISERPFNDSRFLSPLTEPIFIPSGGMSRSRFEVEKFFIYMRKEINRLETFNICNYMFPRNERTLHLPDFYARNGFFYCLSATNIQCAFCRIIFGNICEGEVDIIDRHERFSPDCCFVRRDKHNNIPLITQPLNETSTLGLEQEVGSEVLWGPPPPPPPLPLDDEELMAFIEEMANQVVAELETSPEVQSVIETLQPMELIEPEQVISQEEVESIPLFETGEQRTLMCKVCMTRVINTVHKCGHLALCSICAANISDCVICRYPLIEGRFVYFP